MGVLLILLKTPDEVSLGGLNRVGLSLGPRGIIGCRGGEIGCCGGGTRSSLGGSNKGCPGPKGTLPGKGLIFTGPAVGLLPIFFNSATLFSVTVP